MNLPKPLHEERPWGNELWLTKDVGEAAMVKIITVKPGEALSLQYHLKRDEFWYVLSGGGSARIGTETLPLEKGMNCWIPRQAHHRASGGIEGLVFLEISFGEFDENDIVRLEDKYGRI